jgi:hypothetical protein
LRVALTSEHASGARTKVSLVQICAAFDAIKFASI